MWSFYHVNSLLFVAVIVVGDFGSRASQATQDQIDSCFHKHFDTPNCPNYDDTVQCLKKVVPVDDDSSTDISYSIYYVNEEKDGSCSYLTNKGTCMKVEFPKCTVNFVDLRAANDPSVCRVAVKTQRCLSQLETLCVPTYPMLQEVKDTIKECKTGFYLGRCAPREVDACVDPALKQEIGGRVGPFELERPPVCKQALVETAKQCLSGLRNSCTPGQLQYYREKYDEIVRCANSIH